MSRNSRRTKVRQVNKPQPQPTPPSHLGDKSNPFGISFVVPTHIVELPSCGKYYPQESTMLGREKVEIKQMTAKQEEILSNSDYLLDGTMLDSFKSNKNELNCNIFGTHFSPKMHYR